MRYWFTVVAVLMMAACQSPQLLTTRTAVDKCPPEAPATVVVEKPPEFGELRELMRAHGRCVAEVHKCRASLNGWAEGWRKCGRQ